MSRTYRRRNLNEFTYYSNPLRDSGYAYDRDGNGYWVHYKVSPTSKEGKERLAKFHSDRGHGWLSYKGPSWFARDFAQVPYRARARQAIHNWLRHNQEVILERKPSLPYWL